MEIAGISRLVGVVDLRDGSSDETIVDFGVNSNGLEWQSLGRKQRVRRRRDAAPTIIVASVRLVEAERHFFSGFPTKRDVFAKTDPPPSLYS